MHSKNRHSELVKDPDDFRNYIAFFLDWETETSVTLSLKSFPFKEMFFKVDFILLELADIKIVSTAKKLDANDVFI